MNQPVDLLIIGAGMVGLTCAAACADAGLRVAVVDAGTPPAMPEGKPQLRVSALSRASIQALQRLGAWPLLPAERQGIYPAMQVWENDTLGEIAFTAEELAVDALGAIVENEAVRAALYQSLQQQPNIDWHWQTKAERLSISERGVWLLTDSGADIQAALIVGADGAHSWLRSQTGLPLTRWDYEHHAIVTTIHTELPHQHTAYQAFAPDGPLALLPLADEHTCSIVWSQPPEQAAALLALDDAAFNKVLTVASNNRLGLLSVADERQSWPLTMRYSRDFVSTRLALMGDAAHTIHPLAGQGANLGMMDALSLAQILTAARAASEDIGDPLVLARYSRWRKTEAVKMITAMEGFKRLFTNDIAPLKWARSVGLTLTNKLTPVKKHLMQQACGLSGELPVLAEGAQWLQLR